MTESTEQLRGLEHDLASRLEGEVRFDPMSRGLYSTDASIYQIEPVGVVFPRHRGDVLAATEIAGEYGVPLLPRGSGTSLSGQTVGRAVVLDFSRFMNRIGELDLDRRLIRVEPGVVLDQLNAFLQPHKLQFGPDVATSSRANLGGMIGNNSAGSRSVRQGKVLDHVRELEVVLSDGTELHCGPLSPEALAARARGESRLAEIHRQFPQIIAEHRDEIVRRYPRLLRRVSGYNLDAFVPELFARLPRAAVVAELDRAWPDRAHFNLARLLVGAEGTLGTVTSALLHVVPLPAERGVVLLEFATIDAALEATPAILECEPSAVELLDRHIVELSRTNLKYRDSLAFVSGTPEALLIVEFSSMHPRDIADQMQLLETRLRGFPGLTRLLPAETPAQRDQIWNCRKAGAPLLLSIPGARKPIAFVEDTAVEPARLAEFTRRFRAILSKHQITGAYYGHASVGCLHIRPMIDTKSAADLHTLKQVSDEVAGLVREFGGAMSGEHGDGLARSYHNLKLFGPRLFDAFRQVKELFDPPGRMNPGKVTASPSPIENLRYGTHYPVVPLDTFQDFQREAVNGGVGPRQGFLAAAEACNGSGVCRKTATGTMCPSFMVTRDEEHSTRGRANALRLALTGQLEPGALTSQRLYEVFDLCLLCKGCKNECPSNVDVAKLKVEFLAHYHTVHRPKFGTRLLAQTGWINRVGSALAPVSNWLAGLAPALRERITGIDRRRKLPQFQRATFSQWFDRHTPAPHAGGRGRVLLLDDCLTSHCEPHLGRQGVELLELAGYRVERANLWCCGRPLISKGLLPEAKQLIQRNVGLLDQYASQGVPILGLEPSCLLTLVDEYPDLFPSEATARVARQARLIEAFLAEHWPESLPRGTATTGTSGSTPGAPQVLLHGHCQQKALVGTGATRRALTEVAGLEVREVDSGCCGMAGSFGYEHYDVSQQIGERVLFPAVRAHAAQGADHVICAPGFSCRHQIAEGTERRAWHPIELLHQQRLGGRTH